MPTNLEAVLIGSLDQLRTMLPNVVGSFEKFYAALTPEQRVEIVEKRKGAVNVLKKAAGAGNVADSGINR